MIQQQKKKHQLQSEFGQYVSEQKTRIQQDDEAIYIAEVDGEFVAITKLNDTEEQTIELAAVTSFQASESESEFTQVDRQLNQPSPSSNQTLIIGMGLGIILTIGGMHLFKPSPAENTPIAADKSQIVTPKQSVTVTSVETGTIEHTLKIRGTVAAHELIPVKSSATGLSIKEILVDRGSYVNKGQVLARLDNDVLQAELTQAQAAVQKAAAQLAELKAGSLPEEIAQARQKVIGAKAKVVQAESDLDLIEKRVARNKTLATEGAIARDRLDEILNQEQVYNSNLEQARANLEAEQQALAKLKAGTRPEIIAQAQASLAQAKAKVQSLKAQLADTVVVAPGKGKIAERNATVGDLTSTSTNLFTIIEHGRLELRVKLPETLLAQVKPGQTVTITSDVDSQLKLMGKVREIDPILAKDTPQAIVKIDLPLGTDLKPGMFLDAAITTSTNEGKIVPIDALLPQPDGSAIAYVLQADNTVISQSVTMGEILPERQVEVLTGLQSGDRIVVEGAAYLKDGDSVMVVEPIQN